jgi:phosphosulfolactate synthase
MTRVGFSAVEVSNGVFGLPPGRKAELIALLSRDFVVMAETGLKDAAAPVEAQLWSAEMRADLDAGATWVIAEGRETGSAGLYEPDGRVRSALADLLAAEVPAERVIFEAPQKAQQSWFVRRLGAEVNLGNIPMPEVLALETLRLGLRADTAGRVGREVPAASGLPAAAASR